MERLIPPEWFVGLHWSLLLLIAAAATYGLMTSADWLVHGASRLARRVGIPKVVIGATIVSLGTTSPECAVSVVAAWQGHPGLALGNAVGSIIADSGLIFGLGCLLATLPVDRFLLSRQGWTQFGAASLLAALCYGSYAVSGDAAVLGRDVGFLFLGLLAAYLVVSVHWSRQRLQQEASARRTEPVGTSDEKALLVQSNDEADGTVRAEAAKDGRSTSSSAATDASSVFRAEPAHGTIPQVALPGPQDLQLEMAGERDELPARAESVWWLLGLVFVGVFVVVLTSHVLIQSVSELARQFGVPQVVIAATMVALGTSMPELVVGLTAVVKGHPELLVGNVIGADILNVLFVIGASAAAAPLPILDPTAELPNVFLLVHLPAMLLVLVLFRLFIWKACRQGHFSRWMGAPLVVLYCVYVVIQYAVA